MVKKRIGNTRNPLRADEKKFIVEHCSTLPVAEIAKQLNRGAKVIHNYMNKKGLKTNLQVRKECEQSNTELFGYFDMDKYKGEYTWII